MAFGEWSVRQRKDHGETIAIAGEIEGFRGPAGSVCGDHRAVSVQLRTLGDRVIGSAGLPSLLALALRLDLPLDLPLALALALGFDGGRALTCGGGRADNG